MIKKIWLLLLLFVIFWFWVSFANPIAVDWHPSSTCSKLKNVEIDNYRVVFSYKSTGWYTKFYYEQNIDECLPCAKKQSELEWAKIEVFLLDKSIAIENVNRDIMKDSAISLWKIPTTICNANYVDETIEYKIINSWNGYKLERVIPDNIPDDDYISYSNNRKYRKHMAYRAYGVDRCVRFQNTEIDNYKIIVEADYSEWWDIYIPEQGDCLRWYYDVWESRQYLVDKSVNLDEITRDNIQDKATLIWNLSVYPWNVWLITEPTNNEITTYKIVKVWNDYKLKVVWKIHSIIKNKIDNFLISRPLTIIIETIILFAIAKLFWRKEQISNKKLFLFWILPTTVTLPFLWFVLPLIIWEWIRYVIIWELLVTIIEAVMIKYWLKISRWKAIIASIICNVASYGLWLLIL